MQPNLFDESTPEPPSTGNANNSYTQQHTRSSPRLHPPSHHNAPKGTSEVAAALIAPYANSMQARVYRAIVKSGNHGLTDDEGEALLSIIPQSYTPRRRKLFQLGLIRDSGNRRKTRNWRNAAVWVARQQTAGQSTGSGSGNPKHSPKSDTLN